MHIGEVIREKRKEKGLSQVEVARKAGISVNSLRLYESGKREPRILTLDKIANALDSHIGALADFPEIDPAISGYKAMRSILDRSAGLDGEIHLSPDDIENIKKLPAALREMIHGLDLTARLQGMCLESFNRLNLKGQCAAALLLSMLEQNPEYQEKE